jgi:hypothetical protein
MHESQLGQDLRVLWLGIVAKPSVMMIMHCKFLASLAWRAIIDNVDCWAMWRVAAQAAEQTRRQRGVQEVGMAPLSLEGDPDDAQGYDSTQEQPWPRLGKDNLWHVVGLAP